MPSPRLAILLTLVGLCASAQTPLPPVVHLTTEQDHQRVMDQLHITALRPGVNGDPKGPNQPNFDEAQANHYTSIPDPLTFNSDKKVITLKLWQTQRRAELFEIFDREIYGRVPANTPTVRWEVTATHAGSADGIPTLTKSLIGHVDNSAYPLISVNVELELTTPANATGPVPVMMELGFVHGFPFPAGYKPPPPPPGPDWKQQLLNKGWGYAILSPYSVQADNGAGLTEGIIGLCNHGQPRKLDDWGALRAWAWGASRAMDYFETDPSVNAHAVGIEGNSRFGKTALLAMAYDPRFAIAFISSSGAGGAKLARHIWGETMEVVASSGEYHWMAGNFLKYAGPLTTNDLPVDAHELIALCAPRPVFISAGLRREGDGWVDAVGMFQATVAAGPVYRLYGKRALNTTVFPPAGTALTEGELAFRQHEGGHTPAPNWPPFLAFASRYLPFTPAPTTSH